MQLPLMLKIFSDSFGIENAFFTSVHSYTADQPLRDKVGSDYRRSRSAAENIIPVDTVIEKWIEHVLPFLSGKIEGTVLHVPVANGSVLDQTTILKTRNIKRRIKQSHASCCG